ncbi:mannosyl-oligosaccharide glucosidase [Ditylenchus destructor]|nr:mannosyl-oligosaccharide glucosidase [Ditylenchus destructor]
MAYDGPACDDELPEDPPIPFSDSSNQALDFNDSSTELINELRKVSTKVTPTAIQVDQPANEAVTNAPVASTSFSDKKSTSLPFPPKFFAVDRSLFSGDDEKIWNCRRVALVTLGVVVLTAFLFAAIGLFSIGGLQRMSTNEPGNSGAGVLSSKSDLPAASVVDFAHQKSWGTYRPHLYFGLKAQHVDSPLFGLIWYKQPTNKDQVQLRHWCIHHDPVVYLWNDHDGRSFGIQKIQDEGLSFSTEWLNTKGDSCVANIAVDKKDGNEKNPDDNLYGFIFYFAIPPNITESEMKSIYKLDGNNLSVLDFTSSVFGQLSLGLSVKNTESESKPRFTYLFSKQEPSMNMVNVNSIVLSALEQSPDGAFELKDSGLEAERPNFAAVHLLLNVSDISSRIEIKIQSNGEELPSDFSSELQSRKATFEQRFEQGFPTKSEEPQRKQAALHAVANLLGGIGFWHGYTPIRNDNGSYSDYGPISILSTVPSRPWFPRPFLWDDGFHELLVRRVDPELSTQIAASWLDTMDQNGWIPREQSLDPEGRARMPIDFVFESNVANPPMLIYLTGKYFDSDKMQEEWFAERIRKMYPRLKQLYLWLKTTQSGPLEGTMRWRGRNDTTDRDLNPETLPSGFDDYPRASHPTVEEYHLDLRCWMAYSSQVMSKLAKFMEDAAWMPEIEKDLQIFNDIESLDKLHWSEASQQYSDFGLHSTNMTLVKELQPDGKTIQVRKVFTPPKMGFVDDVNGYSNIFPFLMRLLPANSDKLGTILKGLNDTQTFWSPFGLRSLSAKSRYYDVWNGDGKLPYWRGPIWINMNYFALESLYKYSRTSDKYGQLCRELYTELRENIIKNIVKQYEETGFFWEHYNDKNGQGEGTRPFTGWTALYALILAEQYD